MMTAKTAVNGKMMSDHSAFASAFSFCVCTASKTDCAVVFTGAVDTASDIFVF